MVNCGKCGKQLGFQERHDILVMYRATLKEGLFPEYKDKKLCFPCQRELLDSKGINYRGMLGHKKDFERIKELSKEMKTASHLDQTKCSNCAYSSKTIVQVEKASLTNVMGAITDAGILDYQYLDKWTCAKFKFDVTDRLDLAENCSSFITQSDYEKKCLNGEMEKEKANVQIILDFFSLRDVMSKGGLVMATYKCPNCSGMLDIPEAGNVLICKYCGSPIKPVDIFDKIKTLIQ